MQDEYVEILKDALDHIMRVAGMARVPTRRLDWIVARARAALEGRPYDREDLPKFPANGQAASKAKMDLIRQILQRHEESMIEVMREKQMEIDRLRDLLETYQWAGTAYGAMGDTVARCPECKGIHPNGSLHVGGGKYKKGEGHKPGCSIAKALVEGRDEEESAL
jgi:hypothetical protein